MKNLEEAPGYQSGANNPPNKAASVAEEPLEGKPSAQDGLLRSCEQQDLSPLLGYFATDTKTKNCLMCGRPFVPTPLNMVGCRKCTRRGRAKDGRP